MHFRRLVCLLLGIWLGGTIMIALTAARAHRAADRVLSEPADGSLQYIHGLGRDGAAALLRHGVAEQTRWLRGTWDFVQVLLGASILLLLLFGSHEGRFGLLLSFGMLALAVFETFVLTPQMVSFGRLSDFVAPGTAPGDRARYYMLEGGYMGLEVVKWLLGLALIASLVLRHRKSAARGHVDTVRAEETARRAARR